MKLEFNLWCHRLNVYTKFQINISKRVEKSLENFEKYKTHKNNHQNSENKTLANTVLMSGSIQWATYVPNLKDLS